MLQDCGILEFIKELSALGLSNTILDEAVHTWSPKNEVWGIDCIHVDDFIMAGNKQFEEQVISKLHNVFNISKQETDSFKYLGLQISQNSGKILVDQQHYVESVEDINVDLGNRKRDELLSDEEKKTLKCFVGQLAWAANLTHPDIAFETCEAGVGNSLSTVGDILKARKTLRKLKVSNLRLKFVPLKNLKKCKFWVYSDASHANLKGGASQFGFVIFLVDEEGSANVVKWVSKKISRVVKSTLAAETLALLDAAENAFFLKSMLETMLNIPKSDSLDIICLTDNQSLVENVNKSTKSVSDFRLRVDIACIRNMLQRNEISKITWVSAENQLADCLTKASASCRNLLKVLAENKLPLSLVSQ